VGRRAYADGTEKTEEADKATADKAGGRWWRREKKEKPDTGALLSGFNAQEKQTRSDMREFTSTGRSAHCTQSHGFHRQPADFRSRMFCAAVRQAHMNLGVGGKRPTLTPEGGLPLPPLPVTDLLGEEKARDTSSHPVPALPVRACTSHRYGCGWPRTCAR
jgi:hypothetical protein